MYPAIMAILGHVVKNWTEFDAWALSKGFDPLEVPCRRLVAAAWMFITENMEPEQKEDLIYSLTMEEFTKLVRTPTPAPSFDEDPTTKSQVPNTKWKAPEGWTPPGWDEEKSYQSAMSFINFQANPK